MKTLTLAVYDFRTDPETFMEGLRREIERVLGDTSTGVLRVDLINPQPTMAEENPC